MKVRGNTFKAGFDLMAWYNETMCSTFKCCRLYSWMRLTSTSNIESGVGIDAGAGERQRRELTLIILLDLAPLGAKFRILRERLEFGQLRQILDPPGADVGL